MMAQLIFGASLGIVCAVFGLNAFSFEFLIIIIFGNAVFAYLNR